MTESTTLERPVRDYRIVSDELRRWFGVPFEFRDGDTGSLLVRAEGAPAGDDDYRAVTARIVAERARTEIVLEEYGLVLLALPFTHDDRSLVAVAPFLIEHPTAKLRSPVWSSVLGAPLDTMRGWLKSQRTWDPFALLNVAELVRERFSAEPRERRRTQEVDELSGQVAKSFEEISLIYGITQNLRISNSAQDLCLRAMDWLGECVAARGVSVLLYGAECGDAIFKCEALPQWLTAGEVDVDATVLDRLIRSRNLAKLTSPFVANVNQTSAADWPAPNVDRMILVPIREGENLFGWMAAWGRTNDEEFGSVEANLMQSLASILGIHAGNRELYRRQSELIASVVRTLSAAIDAKDPYTCGHSDRVARISVRLAQQLALPQDMIDVSYMGGLLHDIGKIGIDDGILRKPARLTDEEFEHIKLHPEMGYRILKDIKPFEACLSVVLHHHEAWNGVGYPHKLAGEEIPLLARIAAVADSYDAMTSDRPYRKGMPLHVVEGILRKERDVQWDPQVIDAYFACADDIERIASDQLPAVPVDFADGTTRRLL